MKTPSLPETDYQTRCIEAERTAAQYKKAYFDLLSRYCDMVDKHIAETDREIAVFASTSLTRPIDPFILMKMGANSDVAQCKWPSHEEKESKPRLLPTLH